MRLAKPRFGGALRSGASRRANLKRAESRRAGGGNASDWLAAVLETDVEFLKAAAGAIAALHDSSYPIAFISYGLTHAPLLKLALRARPREHLKFPGSGEGDEPVKTKTETDGSPPPAKVAPGPSGTEPSNEYGPLSAGPRARAILRGKAIAADDVSVSGGSYSLEEVRQILNGVSRQSIEKRVREGRLLAVVGPSNKRFYPVAQFNDDGAAVDGLREVQDAMATRNGYAVLNFLVNPDPRLDSLKPIDLLRRGEIARVVEAAARIGEQGG